MTYARSERKSALLVGIAMLAFALLILPRPSHAMSVSPPTFDFNVNPGETVTDVISLRNDFSVPFQVTPTAFNFYAKAGDETSGNPEFYAAKEVRNGYEIAPWLEFSGTTRLLQKGELMDLPISIHVPKNATPGTHFGAVQLLAMEPGQNPADTSHVSLQAGTAVLIFVRVSGNTKDELAITKFTAQQPILPHLPANFSLRLNNTGNTLQRPVGNILIDDTFGHRVATLNVNPGPDYSSVLPGSARVFTNAWFNQKVREGTSEYEEEFRNFAFGRYTATLLLNYGTATDMKNLTATTTFWVIPWMALATILVILIIIILFLKYGLGGYNKALIRRYESKKPRN